MTILSLQSDWHSTKAELARRWTEFIDNGLVRPNPDEFFGLLPKHGVTEGESAGAKSI